MKNFFTAPILAQWSCNCALSYVNLPGIPSGWISSPRLPKSEPRRMGRVDVVLFPLCRDTWREKCGGWQPTLSCPSVQQWATIKPFASGNYLPSTVCWQYGNSKKVRDITLYICKSISKQQSGLDSFVRSTDSYWQCRLHNPKYVRQGGFSAVTPQPMQNYSRRLAWSVLGGSSVTHLLFLALHRHLPPGGNMSFLFSSRAVCISWNTSARKECYLTICLTVSRAGFITEKQKSAMQKNNP